MKHRPHSPSRLGVALLGVIFAGCGRCGGASQPIGSLPEQLPSHALSIIYVPHPEELVPKLSNLSRLRLTNAVAGLAGAGDAEGLWKALAASLGVDVRSPESRHEAGIALDRGVAWVAVEPGRSGRPQSFVAFAVADPKRVERAVAAISERNFGARSLVHLSADVTGFALSPAAPPLMVLCIRDGWAFVAAGEEAGKLPLWLAAGAVRLSAEPHWIESLTRLDKAADAYFFAPATAPLGWFPAGPLTAAFSLERDGIRLQADLPGGIHPRLAKALELRKSKDLSEILPEDAFAVLRFQGESVSLAPVIRAALPSRFRRSLEEAGIDWEQSFLAGLEPGALAAFSLAPSAPLAQGLSSLRSGANDVFRYVQIIGVAPIQQQAQTAHFLEALQRLGLVAVIGGGPGVPRYAVENAFGGRISVALSGNALIGAAPPERLAAALARLTTHPSARPALWSEAEWQPILGASTLALVVDARQLATSLRALPSESFGVGGFAVRAVLLRWLEMLSELRGAALGASVKGRSAQLELSVRWTPP